MLKPISELAVGDWVVTDSTISSRCISSPWTVQSIVKSRVYLSRSRLNPETRAVEEVDTKFVTVKSIRYVFADEASANAAAAFSRINSADYERKARALVAEHLNHFAAFMARQPVQPSDVSECAVSGPKLFP